MRFLYMTAAVAAAAMSMSPAFGQDKPAAPAPQGMIHVVSYLDAASSSSDEVRNGLKAYARDVLQSAGIAQVEIVQEARRPNRFVLHEIWKDYASYEAHPVRAALQKHISVGLIAPPDVRAHTEWSALPAKATEATAVFGFTHIDVPPTRLEELEQIVRPYIGASRGDDGALKFDLVQGLPPRKNHLTLIETWRDEAAFDKHQSAGHAIEFRSKLGPLLGALYDQRLYSAVRP